MAAGGQRERSGRGSGGALDVLIDRGLTLYSRGDLDGALGEWRRVLDLDPENRRAASYVRYLEEHYEGLAERFAAARAVREGDVEDGSAALVAESYGHGGADYDEYEEVALGASDGAIDIDLGLGPAGPAIATARAVTAAARAPSSDVDAGWSIEDGWTSGDTLGNPAPAAALGAGPEDGERTLDRLADELLDLGGSALELEEAPAPAPRRRPAPRAESTGHDEPTIERPTLGDFPTNPGFDLSELSRERSGRPASGSDHEETAEVRVHFRGQGAGPTSSPPAAGGAPPTAADLAPPIPSRQPTRPTIDLLAAQVAAAPVGRGRRGTSHGGGEDELTVERSAGWRHTRRTAAPPTDGGELLVFDDEGDGTGGGSAAGVTVDRSATEADDDTREQTGFFARVGEDADVEAEPAEGLEGRRVAARAALEASVPDEDGDEIVRRRLIWLLERARDARGRGNHADAVAAADLALEEHLDSATAQKLVHTQKDLLADVYRDCLGDLNAMPALALPMSALASRAIDHRAAFLLSRIDGSLSFEDLLDVAGMPRLEAMRHLCHLILDGVLEIR